MSVGRIIGTVVASAAVAACAAVALHMGRADDAAGDAPDAAFSMRVASTARATFAPLPRRADAAPAGHSAGAITLRPSAAAPVASTSAPLSALPRTSVSPASAPAHPAAPTTSRVAPAAVRTTTPSHAPIRTAPATVKVAPRVAPARRGVPLPLRYPTGSATRVITVTASSHGSTTARLQAWTKAPGGGWLRYGSAVTAHIGAQGMSSHPSESRSATPIGSFTLTQAFGYRADPGTALPYITTRPSDWWISQSGPLYNTHQRCSAHCRFNRGDPNEHLYYERPYYGYAVVIDYNTRNAPGGVRQGAGSAFFLHVTDGTPTAGCVAISQSKLVSLMRWLTPSAHPRILIGVT